MCWFNSSRKISIKISKSVRKIIIEGMCMCVKENMDILCSLNNMDPSPSLAANSMSAAISSIRTKSRGCPRLHCERMVVRPRWKILKALIDQSKTADYSAAQTRTTKKPDWITGQRVREFVVFEVIETHRADRVTVARWIKWRNHRWASYGSPWTLPF